MEEKMSKVDIIEKEKKYINTHSKQEWISFKDYTPYNMFKFNHNEDSSKGDFNGRYLCIVEREVEEGYQFLLPDNKIFTTVEMCYWNCLAEKFQDNDNEWVKVTHWTQVPDYPE